LESQVPLLQAHSGVVTDFQFSPFDDCLLATGSEDLSVRLWRIPPDGLTESLSAPETTLKGHDVPNLQRPPHQPIHRNLLSLETS
jgi:WD40 repeat protein